MRSIKGLTTVLTSLFFWLQGATQPAAPLFPPQQLLEDYTLFVKALQEAHPGLYRYTPKAEWDSLFTRTGKSINRPMSEEAFYTLLAPLVARIRCGHTKWHRKGRPDDPYAFNAENLFPLKLYFVDGTAYIEENYDTAVPVKAGAEILSINGQPIAGIIAHLRSRIPVDGYVESAVYEELNQSFPGTYATFVGTTPYYRLTYKEGGVIKSAVLQGVSVAAILAKEDKNKPKELPLRLTFPATHTAVLTIERFYTDEGEQGYTAFIDSAFRVLKEKGVKHLAIDLRNNEGGKEEWGGYLFRHLAQRSFRYYHKIKVVQKEEFSFRQHAILPAVYDAARPLVEEKEGEALWTRQEYLHPVEPAENAFKGATYILLNGRSFSVTAEFAAVAHHHGRAVFIGEESGGAYGGNNSGVFVQVVLPHTGLTLAIPLLGYYMHVKDLQPGRGVLPHHEVKPTVADKLAGRDAVMAYTLDLIRKGNERK